MTATTINTKTTPTADAIQDALEFLKNLSEKNSAESAEDSEKTKSFFSSDVFKTIEATLKNSAEAKAVSENGEKTSEDEDETVREKKQAAFTASQDTDETDEEAPDTEDDNDDEGDEEDNPFAGEYYWNPGPEWKTIGLVAGGAALVGLGALLYKLFDD